MSKSITEKYLRVEQLPLPFCIGCGNGIVLGAICKAMGESGIRQKDFVFVSGIGCSAWISNPYMRVDAIHTVHGRAIPTATGIKLANPRLKVMVVTGDGDGAGIGGNHLIHAARTNADVKVILVNNSIYGMTGGQVAPTTPAGKTTATTPFKNSPHPFDLSKLMVAAGASYVARWTTYHVNEAVQSIRKAMLRKGFCFVEILSQCPTYYGQFNRLGSGAEMMKNFGRMTSKKDEKGKIRIGEFVNVSKETLGDFVRPNNES